MRPLVDQAELPDADGISRQGATFLTRVVLTNYKSIAACDVRLGPLTFLVGPNGSGKSNFLDALRFVADALNASLDHALRDRGGIKDVRRRSGGHPTHFGIRLDFVLNPGLTGFYAFRIGARSQGAYEVQTERCEIRYPEPDRNPRSRFYHVRSGEVIGSNLAVAPPAASDRLFLVHAAGLPGFRSLYGRLCRMGFYNLNPDRIRDLQPPDPGELLAREGGNLASVLARLNARSPEVKRRIEEYLAKVVPGVYGVDPKVIGPKETLEFRQEVAGSQHPWRFLAANMSDGTLRALGILVALLQGSANHQDVPLVGIEEPEVALHPAAAGVLRDSLRDASDHTQVLVTSHSPDLIDDAEIATESLLAVVADQGVTRIGPLDAAGRSALREHLYTAGELLRLNQLLPDPRAIPDPAAIQARLFELEAT